MYTRAYVLYLIGGVLFPSGNRDTVHPRWLQFLQNKREIHTYAWGAAVLADLFRALSKVVKRSVVAFDGYRMLLQLWAWERLLPGQPRIAQGQEFTWPRSLAWAVPVAHKRINPITTQVSIEVSWIPCL